MLSILAGMMIALGGTIFLSVGGVIGASLFAIGLMTICVFQLELFTGKVGLLATNGINVGKVIEIWFGNLFGTMIVGFGIILTPIGLQLSEKAVDIVALRIANGPFANLALGIFCGLLMYIAVTAHSKTNNPLYLIFPVATFILCGFNHCVADMFYLSIGAMELADYTVLIPTTLGNVIGCNVIPTALCYYYGGELPY